jgi:hypothetical protein
VWPCDKLRDNTEMIRSPAPHLTAPLVSYFSFIGPDCGTQFFTDSRWKS